MPKGSSVNLTMDRVRKAGPGFLWDSEVHGFGLRVHPSGTKRYVLQYRVNRGGRKAPQRRFLIGDWRELSLADARAIAREKLVEVARGNDPQRARRQKLGDVLDRYERALIARQVVKHKEVMANLRNHLLGHVGDVPLAELDRAALVEAIDKLEQSGLSGAATVLRANARTFMGWACDSGLIPHNPLAGWRKPRSTRAERLEKPKRSLADWEIPIFWQAAEAAGWPFGPYLQGLLLHGQRLVESSLMAWPGLNIGRRSWRIPPEVAKAGREHLVPLPQPLIEIIQGCPVMRGSPLVFPAASGKPITGFGTRIKPVRKATAAAGMAHWTPHDLRRTMRTGLARLGVERNVSELMLNHAVPGELEQTYNLHDYWDERVAAAKLWADHVMALVNGPQPEVVHLRA